MIAGDAKRRKTKQDTAKRNQKDPDPDRTGHEMKDYTMNNQNDAANGVTNDAANDVAAKSAAKSGGAWVKRFGPMTKLSMRTGKNNKPFALFELDCKTFKQTGFAFGDKAIADLKALGVGKNIYIKGVMQETVKTNASGGTYTEQTFHAIYVSENKAGGAKRAAKADGEASAQVEPQVETVAVDDLAGVF